MWKGEVIDLKKRACPKKSAQRISVMKADGNLFQVNGGQEKDLCFVFVLVGLEVRYQGLVPETMECPSCICCMGT